jgi:hypothetical protein
MYLGGRVRDATAIENHDAGSNSRNSRSRDAGSLSLNVYNFRVGADVDSRRDCPYWHRHTHR